MEFDYKKHVWGIGAFYRSRRFRRLTGLITVLVALAVAGVISDQRSRHNFVYVQKANSASEPQPIIAAVGPVVVTGENGIGRAALRPLEHEISSVTYPD
jgi:hypothetical protein